jgi:hypothetical protein
MLTYSCEPSNNGASFGPNASNENLVTRSTPVEVLRATSVSLFDLVDPVEVGLCSGMDFCLGLAAY